MLNDFIVATEIIERQESARAANTKIREYWERKPSEKEINAIIQEKLLGLSQLTKSYLIHLLYQGGYIGTSREEMRRVFLGDEAVLEELDKDSTIDPGTLFEQIDQECLASGVISAGYTTKWKINNRTGELYDENANKEEGRRFALPIYYQTFEELLKPV